jgi:hypothetical protein
MILINLHREGTLFFRHACGDGDDGFSDDLTVFGLDLQLRRHHRERDRLGSHLQLEKPDAFDVQLDEDQTVVRLVDFLQVFRHFAQDRLLDSALDSSSELGICWKPNKNGFIKIIP